MKTTFCGAQYRGWVSAAFLVIAMAIGNAANAQDLLGQPSWLEEESPTRTGTKSSGAALSVANDLPAQWGPFTFRRRAIYRMAYAEGLPSATGESATTYVQTASARFRLEKDPWNFYYSPSWTRYSESSFRDSFGHQVGFDTQIARPSWSGSFSQAYALSDSPLVQTGRQTAQQVSSTNASAIKPLGNRMKATLTGSQQLTFMEAQADTYQWSAGPSLGYFFSDSLSVSVGADTGYVLVYESSDMTFLRPTAGVSWAATEKTSLSAQVGSDNWRFTAGEKKAVSSLYYSLSLSYTPFSMTTLSLGAQRGNSPSPFREQVTQTTGWSLRLRQRILRHFNLTAGYQEQQASYIMASGVGEARSDQTRGYDVKLGTTFLRHGKFSLFYRSNRNASDIPGFGFTSNQFGFEIEYGN